MPEEQQAGDPAPVAARPGRLELGVAAAALGVLVVEHIVHGVRRLPAAYGGESAAEYLEHLRRVEVYDILARGDGPDAWANAMRALERVEFPPLLVLLQHPLDRLFGPHIGVAVAANLGWLALVGVATVALGRGLGLARGAAWAGVLVVLMPGIWGPARAYYYDLPMLAMVTLGAAAAVACVRRPGVLLVLAVAASWAVAELIKWEAVLYVAAALPAIGLAATLGEGPRGRRALGVVGVGIGALGAVGLVAAYVRRHDSAFQARFGQAVSLQDADTAASPLVSGPLGRLAAAPLDAWAFYPSWLTASSLGLVFVLLLLVALSRAHRLPRSAAVAPVIAAGGTLVALVAISDIAEVRFIHPALPWLAVLLGGGLAALPGRAGRVAPLLAVVLAVAQLLAADYVREGDRSRWRTGWAVPWPLSLLLGGGVSPLIASPGNQTGWRRPVDHQVNDALAVRSALEWVVSRSGGRGATVALHSLNRELGRADYAWRFWALHRGAGLEVVPSRPVEDCGVDLRAPDGPWARGAYVVVDFDPALLGAGKDAWCDAIGCRGGGTWADVDPCGVMDDLVEWGAGLRSSPPIPYRSRFGGVAAGRRLWVLERPR